MVTLMCSRVSNGSSAAAGSMVRCERRAGKISTAGRCLVVRPGMVFRLADGFREDLVGGLHPNQRGCVLIPVPDVALNARRECPDVFGSCRGPAPGAAGSERFTRRLVPAPRDSV